MSEWISVKDRLPEYEQRVIACWGKRKENVGELRYMPKRRTSWQRNGSTTNWPITHWMPLPDPPKEQS